MKSIETKNHHFCSTLERMMNNTHDDDDSTVSYFDDTFVREMNNNSAAHHRQSFASATSNDDSTVSTDASTIEDRLSYTIDDDFSDCFDDVSVDVSDLVSFKERIDASSYQPVKHVTFGNSTIREYGITVDTCTLTNTGRCPMTLTWDYTEPYMIETKQNDPLSHHKRCRPRALSVAERRERIAVVQGISDDDVTTLEYQTSISLVEETLKYLELSRLKYLYSMESPSPQPDFIHTTFSCQKISITSGSNDPLRKTLLQEISITSGSNDPLRKTLLQEIPFNSL